MAGAPLTAVSIRRCVQTPPQLQVLLGLSCLSPRPTVAAQILLLQIDGLWRRDVSTPFHSRPAQESCLSPILEPVGPRWVTSRSGPPSTCSRLHRHSSPGRSWRHSQLLCLRRQSGAQVERDHDKLRQGEGGQVPGGPFPLFTWQEPLDSLRQH